MCGGSGSGGGVPGVGAGIEKVQRPNCPFRRWFFVPYHRSSVDPPLPLLPLPPVPITPGSLLSASGAPHADSLGVPEPHRSPLRRVSRSKTHPRTWFQLGRLWFTISCSAPPEFEGAPGASTQAASTFPFRHARPLAKFLPIITDIIGLMRPRNTGGIMLARSPSIDQVTSVQSPAGA